MIPAPAGKAKTAHVIVLGNEKGGAGKSTMAINVIVALLKAGHSVASVDTDSRQRSLTRMIENRAAWARRSGLWLEVPTHYVVKLGRGEVVREIEAHEFDGLADVIDQVEHEFDFVVVDTPANNSYLMRISHSMADTLITPINDSLDGPRCSRAPRSRRLFGDGVSHYAELVREARQQRRLIDGVATDWIVVRNRLATLASRNQRHVVDALGELSTLLDFRLAGGVSERVIFRELFAMGLTALDGLDRQTLGGEPTISHVAGRQEIRDLVDCLHLPGDAAQHAAGWRTQASLSGVRMLRCDAGRLKDCFRGFQCHIEWVARPGRRGRPGSEVPFMADDKRTPVNRGEKSPPAERSSKSEIDAFLAQARAAVPAGDGRGRMIFALDATMSRQPTWDTACRLQAEMFEEAGKVGGLDVQLVYFRGFSECRASRWVSDARASAT